jgi:soluble lytic murein transglycosylase-like protein
MTYFRRLEVNSESAIINSAGSLVCGIFSVMMFLLFIGLPVQDTQEKIYPILKGVRPYNPGVIDADISRQVPGNQFALKEALFSPIINKAANKYNIDPALVKAIILAESGYDPMATSEKGAIGLMQIMPNTVTELSTEDMYNPVHNINAGVEYLRFLLNQFGGDLELAIAAYNAGSSKVREYQGVPPYESTKNFVKEVFEYYKFYQGV